MCGFADNTLYHVIARNEATSTRANQRNENFMVTYQQRLGSHEHFGS